MTRTFERSLQSREEEIYTRSVITTHMCQIILLSGEVVEVPSSIGWKIPSYVKKHLSQLTAGLLISVFQRVTRIVVEWNQGSCLSSYLVYSHCLEQCQVKNWYSVNTYLMNRWMNYFTLAFTVVFNSWSPLPNSILWGTNSLLSVTILNFYCCIICIQ